ncbi:MAG TPA: hypothetical protein EYN34_01420 [Aquifex sp.]|nr:hypothetical protein [Aquifex sp.]
MREIISALKGVFGLVLVSSAVFLFSCSPYQERKFNEQLVVKEQYGLPIEVLKAQVRTSGGYKKLEVLMRNVSDEPLTLECKIAFISEGGFYITIPGYGVDICRIPPHGVYKEVVKLPVDFDQWRRLIVEIERFDVRGSGNY